MTELNMKILFFFPSGLFFFGGGGGGVVGVENFFTLELLFQPKYEQKYEEKMDRHKHLILVMNRMFCSRFH